MCRYIVSAVTLSVLWSPGVGAQQVRPVVEGSTVRLWASESELNKTSATVLAWREGSVLVSRTDEADTLSVPFASLTRLDAFRGRRSAASSGLRGALIGVALGGTLGTVAGLLEVEGCRELLCELDALSYMAGGLLIGGVVGAGVGATHRPERWERVELPVWAGFPPARRPFTQSAAFKTGLAVVGVLVALAVGGS